MSREEARKFLLDQKKMRQNLHNICKFVSHIMTLHRLNHAIAFVFGGYQDYDKFYTPSLLDDDGGLFVVLVERLAERDKQKDTHNGDDARFDDGGTKYLSDEGKPSEGLPDVTNIDESTNGDEATQAKSSFVSKDSGRNGAHTEGRKEDHAVNGVDLEQQEGACDPYTTGSVAAIHMTREDVNPVRLASAHIQLKLLKGHDYNIFEAAFFYSPDGDRGEYILNSLQVTVTYLGMFYLFYFLGNEIKRTYQNRGDVWLKDDDGHDKEWAGILIINAIALGYFFFLLGRDIDRVVNFNRRMRKLCPYDKYTSYRVKSHRWWSLFNNHCVNIVMGYSLFVLNFFFVQSVNDMVDAILNAIAVIFIIQIDDVIPPYKKSERIIYFLNIEYFPIKPGYLLDWNNSAIHGKLMEIVEAYLSHPDPSNNEVNVKKIEGDSVGFCETDVCYFFVNKAERLIRIFQGRLPENNSSGNRYVHEFQQVMYQVEGEGAMDFLEAMAGFECVEEEEEGLQKLNVLDDQRIKKTVVPTVKSRRA